jgi:D-alanine-D-alanine ligase
MDGRYSNAMERIALLAGGNSAERQVSFASGQQVAIALALAGYEPVLIDPAEVALRTIDWPSFDCCFIALHGGAGEDGRVQAELEAIGIPYTGSRPATSRLAMSKSAAKERFAGHDVPTPPFVRIDRHEKDAARQLESLRYPLVIKPDGQGSSLGVQIAEAPGDLQRCLGVAAEFDSKLIAERWIDGREFTIALLGRDPLPLIEIIAPQSVFTYDAKYASRRTEYRFDSDLQPSVVARLYDTAISAAEALGTAGLVRVDLMLDRQNQPWVLELNTIPGMTAQSLVPRAAAAAGIGLPSLVTWIVRDAVHWHKQVGRSILPIERTSSMERAHSTSRIRDYVLQ